MTATKEDLALGEFKASCESIVESAPIEWFLSRR
jgi:hypothetical protein